MKKVSIVLFLLILLQACNFPISAGPSFDEQVATQAAVAYTQTAIEAQKTIPTITVQPTSSDPTVTPTPDQESPRADLGSPAWQDTVASGSGFGLGSEVEQITDTNATVWIEDGKFNMYRSSASGGYIWYCSYPNISDFYLEGKFETQSCNGKDEYGLSFRKPDFYSTAGYYFIVTCEGTYNLMRWTSGGSTLLADWKEHDVIVKGPQAQNTLGILAEGNQIKLYINDQFLAEFNDDAGLNSGYFGLFSNAKQTAGLHIMLDEVSYWNIP